VASFFATTLPQIQLTHLVIDNSSTDQTVEILRDLCKSNPNLRVIVNSRNFGPHKSPFHAKLQMKSQAVIPFVADMQMPIELIPKFIQEWENGSDSVIAERISESEGFRLKVARKLFYKAMDFFTGEAHLSNFVGFGLFDSKVIDTMALFNDPEPYFRGLLQEVGFPKSKVTYHQPARLRGVTKQNFWDYFEYAALSLTKSTSRPLFLVAMSGFVMSTISLLLAIVFTIAKLVWWNSFAQGTIPILVVIFLFCALNTMFLGLLGLYLNVVLQQVRQRPLVVEAERINF